MEETSKQGGMSGIDATGDINKQRFVGYDGAVCGLGEKAAGVSQYDTESGNRCTIQTSGPAVVVCGGTITEPGTPIASDADGKAIEATLPEGTTPVTWSELLAVNGYAAGDPDFFPKSEGDTLRVNLSL